MKRVFGTLEIEKAVRPYLRRKGWAFLDCRISYFEAYQSFYGAVEADKVSQMFEQLIGKVLEELGTPEDVLGSDAADQFVIITSEAAMALKIKATLKTKFNSEVLTYYSALDREHNYILAENQYKVPLMSLSVGVVSKNDDSFLDIRELFARK